MQTPRIICVCALAAAALLPATAARAGFYESVAQGLFIAGFPLDVQRNPLTGGYNATASRSFFNDTARYGLGTLTLTGGMTFDGWYNKRPVPGMSFEVKSTANPDGQPLPMTYTLTIPRAVEQVTVTGTVTFDVKTTVDATGYYNRVINIENRGTVTTTGLAEGQTNIDFNIGPVNQTGNFYLEGIGGIVTLLGGDGSAIANLPNSPPLFSASQADLDALDLNDPEQLEAYVNAVLLDSISQAAVDPRMGEAVTRPSAVPEPSTLALLVISGSLAWLGAFRRHFAR